MAYTETPQYNANTSDKNYNDTGTLLDTDIITPVEVVAFGVIITGAFTVSTAPIMTMSTYAADRTTATSQGTLTIPTTAVVGNSYLNRLSTPVQMSPAMFARIAITTQGVGSAGTFRAFLVYKYSPLSDVGLTTQTIVTA